MSDDRDKPERDLLLVAPEHPTQALRERLLRESRAAVLAQPRDHRRAPTADETTPLIVYKVTMMVVDHDRLGRTGVTSAIENARYGNRCISPTVIELDARDIEWHDRHPLNLLDKRREEFKRIFAELDERGVPR